MVMFKARFHTPEPEPDYDPERQPPESEKRKPPPIEDERGPQAPVELPGQQHEPERV